MVPLPVSETVCGLPFALSVIEMVPVAVPFTCGAKETEIVQLAAAARLAGHVLVWVKAALARTAAMVRLAVPVLVTVTV
jgi:hypothetical protein